MTAFVPVLLMLAASSGIRPPVARPAVLKTVTACGAISRADLEQVLGRTLSPGMEERASGLSTCDYTAGNGQVTISIQRLTGKLNLRAEIASLKAAMPGSTVREAAVMGTRAFFLDIGDDGTQLHIVRDDRDYILVSILGLGDSARVSVTAERIARKVLDRL